MRSGEQERPDARAILNVSSLPGHPRSIDETAEDIFRDLARFKPNVVNCHSFYGHLPYGFLATVSQSYPTCFTVHDPRPIGTMEPVCWGCDRNATYRQCPFVRARWRRYLRNDFYRQRKIKRQTHRRWAADMQIVSPSRWMAERLAAQELRRFEPHHVPYGIDLNRFRFVGRTRSLFGLPADVPIILFVAWYDSKRTLNLRKGLPDVAEAFETVVIPKIPDAILAVAGESFVPNHPNVRPLGMISQDWLPYLLSAANVYVTATLADNLPYTVLEAMACAIPVVATNVGGVPEEVIHGETGLLVPPSNPHK